MRVKIVNGKGEVVLDSGNQSNYIEPPKPVVKEEKNINKMPTARIVHKSQTIESRIEPSVKEKLQEIVLPEVSIVPAERPLIKSEEELNNIIINEFMARTNMNQEQAAMIFNEAKRLAEEDVEKEIREKKEQEKIKEDEERKVKQQFISYNLLSDEMRKFPFENYRIADQKQKRDIKTYLLAAITDYNEKNNFIESEKLEMVVDDYIESQYSFSDIDTEKYVKYDPNTQIEYSKEEVSEEFYTDPKNEIYEDYDNEPKFSKIRNGKGKINKQDQETLLKY